MNKRQLLIVWLLYSKMKITKMRFINTWCIENFQLEIWNQHKLQNSQYYSHLNENWSASLFTIQVGPIQTSNHQFTHSQTNNPIYVYTTVSLSTTYTQPRTHLRIQNIHGTSCWLCLNFPSAWELFVILIIHVKVYFSIWTIGRRRTQQSENCKLHQLFEMYRWTANGNSIAFSLWFSFSHSRISKIY